MRASQQHAREWAAGTVHTFILPEIFKSNTCLHRFSWGDTKHFVTTEGDSYVLTAQVRASVVAASFVFIAHGRICSNKIRQVGKALFKLAAHDTLVSDDNLGKLALATCFCRRHNMKQYF